MQLVPIKIDKKGSWDGTCYVLDGKLATDPNRIIKIRVYPRDIGFGSFLDIRDSEWYVELAGGSPTEATSSISSWTTDGQTHQLAADDDGNVLLYCNCDWNAPCPVIVFPQ